MNRNLFRSQMAKNGDTVESLAEKIGLSKSRLSSKINGTRGAEFNQREISTIICLYGLSPDDLVSIFFSEAVS